MADKTKINYDPKRSHISQHGYIKVFIGRDHLIADGSGYAYEHRVAMINKLGRPLKRNEIIHHKDGDRTSVWVWRNRKVHK